MGDKVILSGCRNQFGSTLKHGLIAKDICFIVCIRIRARALKRCEKQKRDNNFLLHRSGQGLSAALRNSQANTNCECTQAKK